MAVNREGSESTGHNGGGFSIEDKRGDVLSESKRIEGVATQKAAETLTPDVEINAEIMKLIQLRIDEGAKKYGGGIMLHDGRNWLVEALEEVLDCCVYLAAMIIKIKRGAKWENLTEKNC
jgi:hypothetical protein